MRLGTRKILISLSLLALVGVGASASWLYYASRQIPHFYQEAIARDPVEQEGPRDEFVAQATALASDLHRSGHWQTLFTVEQINAWLALELSRNYPGILPGELHEPRIEIGDKEATLACRYEHGGVSAVLSLTVDVYLQEPQVLAIRIRRARAGALPIPLAQVLDGISHAARELKLRLEWRKAQGEPVALINLSGFGDSHAKPPQLQVVELRQGELFVSGTISSREPDSSPTPAKATPLPTARLDKPKSDQPIVGSALKETRQE